MRRQLVSGFNASGAVVLVADGLGHGLLAAEASREAVRVFRKRPMDGPVAALQTAHAALRSTRGSAGAVAHIDCERRVITYAGVGNIAGVVLSASERWNMASYTGTLGHEVRTFTEFTYAWPPDAMMGPELRRTRHPLDPRPLSRNQRA